MKAQVKVICSIDVCLVVYYKSDKKDIEEGKREVNFTYAIHVAGPAKCH